MNQEHKELIDPEFATRVLLSDLSEKDMYIIAELMKSHRRSMTTLYGAKSSEKPTESDLPSEVMAQSYNSRTRANG